LPKFFAPISFLFLSLQPLFGAEPRGAVPAETALPSGNDSKVQSGEAASRRENAVLYENTADPKAKRYSGLLSGKLRQSSKPAKSRMSPYVQISKSLSAI
jgi:hypothetical protein